MRVATHNRPSLTTILIIALTVIAVVGWLNWANMRDERDAAVLEAERSIVVIHKWEKLYRDTFEVTQTSVTRKKTP